MWTGVQVVAEVDQPQYVRLTSVQPQTLQRLLVLERLQDPGNLVCTVQLAKALYAVHEAPCAAQSCIIPIVHSVCICYSEQLLDGADGLSSEHIPLCVQVQPSVAAWAILLGKSE